MGHEVLAGNQYPVVQFGVATIGLVGDQGGQGLGVGALPRGPAPLNVLDDALGGDLQAALLGGPDGGRREERAGQPHEHAHDGDDGDNHPHRACAHGGPPLSPVQRAFSKRKPMPRTVVM